MGVLMFLATGSGDGMFHICSHQGEESQSE
jgi:hypothetical protein